MTRLPRKTTPSEPEKTMLAIKLPETERGVGPSALARFDKAQRALANPMTKPRAREEHARAMARIEAAPKEAADKAWQEESLAETVDLAAARGEEVALEKSGVKRIVDRDPLLSLFRAGCLTETQLEAGQAARDLYDLRQGDSSSVSFDAMPSGSHDHERFVANRFLRAKASIPIGQLETAILNGHFRTQTGALVVLHKWPAMKAAGMDPHVSLTVLRWVCCEHNTLTSMARGRAYERNRAALCWALDLADAVLDARSGRAKAAS